MVDLTSFLWRRSPGNLGLTRGDRPQKLRLGSRDHLTKVFITERGQEGKGPAVRRRTDTGEKRSEWRFQMGMGTVSGGGVERGVPEVSRKLQLLLLVPLPILRKQFKVKF